MSRVRSIATNPRRFVPVLLIAAVALLVAAGLLVDPASRTRGTASPDGSAPVSSPELGSGLTDLDAEDRSRPGATADLVEPQALAPGNEAARAGVAVDEASAGGDVAPSTTTEPVVGRNDAPAIDARIVRNGSVELRVKRGSFDDAWADAQSVAGALGGYIVSASRSGAGDGPRAGSITLRVPGARFDRAVERLRDISDAKLRRLDIASQDVTQEYVDVRSRLKHDRSVEARLLALLAQTKGVSEVLAVQARLDGVQEQIEVSQGRLDYLEKMTSMGTIELQLTEPGAKSKPEPAAKDDEPSVIGEAFGDARERFSENVASAVVWMGGALPSLVLLAMVALVGRFVWNRRSSASRVTDAD